MHKVPEYVMPDWKKAYAENDFEHLLRRVKEEYSNSPGR